MASGRTPEHNRRSIRLRDYDYAQAGAYFVTICTQNRDVIFDEPALHKIASDCWEAIPEHFPNVALDEWVVMPNHLHGVLVFLEGRGVQLNAPTGPSRIATRDPDSVHSLMSPRRNTLGTVIRAYKASVTALCRGAGCDEFGWQRNYYEHIIRDERELHRIRRYVRNNPARWESDENNPANISSRRPAERKA